MELFEQQVAHSTVYRGIIVDVEMDSAQVASGNIHKREVVRHPGGVAVVALEDNGNVILVRQWRYPYGRVVTEIPAGKRESGEAPLDCAKRELSEEVGVTAAKWTFLGENLASPGFCDETIHLFLAEELTYGSTHPDEDEFLEVVHLPLTDVVDSILKNQLSDGKTVAGILKAKLLRGL